MTKTKSGGKMTAAEIRTAHPTGLDQLVPYWVKRLADAIAQDTFHETVCALLVATMSEAYDRGFAEGRKGRA